GLGLATVGLASEWAWTYVFTPIPWPATLAGSGIPFGVAAAFAGAFIGAWIGTRLQETRQPVNPGLRRGAVVGAIGIAVLIAVALPKPTEPGTTATVQLRDVQGKPGTPASEGRAVEATITLSPPDAAKEAKWFTATAWQGNGFIVDRLEEIGPGRYRTTQPIPVHGNWKALVRLHVGRSLGAIPLFLPADAAIGAVETPALQSFTREFVADHTLLQREQKPAPGGLTLIAYLTVVLIAFALLCLLVWGIHRLGKLGPEPGGPGDPAIVRAQKDRAEKERAQRAAKPAASTPRRGATGEPGAVT
ncbi:MAG: hypothetical protein Q7T55_12290, partial [Solirubrobacteraceae bacterium]|nr:hypothetical protein [Solirubrobacteraceae bacterium]